MTSSSPTTSIQLGSYQLRERVGEGAMGQVYRAVGQAGELVAIKLLGGKGSAFDDEAARARFAREVAVLSGLDHPALPRLLGHGIDPDLGPWLAMPFISGTTLRALGGSLCPEAVLLLCERLCGGLAVLHGAGLVHRDIKPENVMLSPDGQVRLLDLGLAFTPGQTRHTEEGAVSGSVPYLSPEQIDNRQIVPASDVWAVAVVAYELITGKRPFERSRPSEEVAAILSGSFKPIEGVDRRVSRELGALLGRCLKLEARERPADAQQLGKELRRLIDWIPEVLIGDELAALAGDPPGYQGRVASFRVAALEREARQALSGGDAFRALRLLDRGLAYRPDEPRLLALVEQASAVPAPQARPEASAAPTPQPQPQPPPVRRARWPLFVAIAALPLAALLAFVLWPKAPQQRPAVVAQAQPAPQPAPAPTRPAAPPDDRHQAASVDVEPLDPASLSNSDPRLEMDQTAAPGEPLIPASMLGSAGPAAALESLKQQVAEHPEDHELEVGLALVMLGNGQTRDGVAMLDRLLDKYPELPIAWSSRAYVALRQGKLDLARKAFDRAIELDPRDATSLRNRAILARREGRTRDAYVDLARAFAIDPDDDEAIKELAQIYQQAGKREAARPLILRLLRLHPDFAQGWFDLSLVEPDLADALHDVEKGLALEPESPLGNQRHCNVLARMERPEAEAACSKAMRMNPADPGIQMDRGVARYHAGDDKGALEDMDVVIRKVPDKASYFTNRYLVHAHAGDLAAARADLDAACKLGSEAACDQRKKLQ